jgi:glutamate formiminotransferase
MIPVLEAVPNLSSGTDPAFLEEAIRVADAAGADVVDHSADPDHDRAVLTILGAPARVEEAAVALARLAASRLDLRGHRGVHPRIGALDVLPFVPLQGLSMEDAVRSARRVGGRIAAEAGVPVWFYGAASDPPGRTLAELRRGGFELLAGGIPEGREPDLLPPGWDTPRVHPSAGGVCVGARPVLLAWNVDVEGVPADALRRLASTLRASSGGPEGLRVLALELPAQGRAQLSMNLEDARERAPFAVFRTIEAAVAAAGGRVVRTEIIGLAPDELVGGAAADRLRTLDRTPPPVLSSHVAGHLSRRATEAADRLLEAARRAADALPESLVEALAALEEELLNPPDGTTVE